MGFGVQVSCGSRPVLSIGGGCGTGWAGSYGNLTAGGGGGAGIQCAWTDWGLEVGGGCAMGWIVRVWLGGWECHNIVLVLPKDSLMMQHAGTGSGASRVLWIYFLRVLTMHVAVIMCVPVWGEFGTKLFDAGGGTYTTSLHPTPLGHPVGPHACPCRASCVSVCCCCCCVWCRVVSAGGGGGVHFVGSSIQIPNWGTSTDPGQVGCSSSSPHTGAHGADVCVCVCVCVCVLCLCVCMRVVQQPWFRHLPKCGGCAGLTWDVCVAVVLCVCAPCLRSSAKMCGLPCPSMPSPASMQVTSFSVRLEAVVVVCTLPALPPCKMTTPSTTTRARRWKPCRMAPGGGFHSPWPRPVALELRLVL